MPSAAEPGFGTELCGLPLTDCTTFGSAYFDEQFSAYGHVRLLQQDEDFDDFSLASSCLPADDSVSTNASLETIMAAEAAMDDLDEDDFEEFHLHHLSSVSLPSGPLLSSPFYDDAASSFQEEDGPLVPDDSDAYSPLDQLRRVCSMIKKSAIDVYAQNRQDHAGALDTRAHMDGGASASTTDCFEALWSVRPLHRRVRLKVADDTVHSPTHEGYLKIPTLGGGYVFVHCYYTKQIPATIVSPFNTLRRLRYHGCTTHVTIDGTGCSVRLSHPRQRLDDVVFPCTSVDGLLYSAAFVMPTAFQRESPLPIAGYVRTVRTLAHSYIPPPPKAPCCLGCAVTSPERCPACEPPPLPVSVLQCQECGDAPADSCPECGDAPADSSSPSCTNHSVEVNTELSDQFLRYLRLGMMPDAPLDVLDPSVDHICSLSCDHCSNCVSGAGEGDPPPAALSSSAVKAGEGAAVGEGTPVGEGTAPSVSDIDYDDHPPWPDYSAADHCVCQMTAHQEQFLWHARLSHPNNYLYESMVKNKTASGLPASSSVAHEIDNCPVCQKAKLTKAPRSKTSSRRATKCFQGLSFDFGFIVQSSKDSKRLRRLQGFHGETCYLVITDHHSGTVWGECFSSKAAPVDFIDDWLRKYGLPRDHPDTYVRLDGGGELGRNREVLKLFKKAGYDVERTAPDSSHQNGPGERPHRSIGNALRAILSGAGLDARFWPFAFHHYLRIYNLVPHAKRLQSPYQICTGKVPDLSFLRVFGCRVYVLPPRPRRPSKLENDPNVGIFLGYSQTVKKILYYDVNTHEVKEGSHVAFDETSFDHQNKTPNAELLSRLRSGEDPSVVFDADIHIPDIDVSLSPFTATESFQIPFKPDHANPLGLSFADCDRLGRAFVTDMKFKPKGRTVSAFRKHFRYSYVVSIGDVRVYDTTDVDSALQQLCDLESPPSHVEVILAPERRSELKAQPPSMYLQSHDIRRIAALLSVENADSVLECRNAVQSFYDSVDEDVALYHIQRLQTAAMTDEERALTKFSRRNLKKLSTWPEWQQSFYKQLNSHYDDGTIGYPVLKSSIGPNDAGIPPQVLRIVWSNFIKTDGTRKVRACADGSKRAAPWLRGFINTYSSCIELPCQRLFFALSAALGYVLTVADTSNAFQQAPPPPYPCYLRIDESYQDWYKHRFGKDIDADQYVVPVLKNLQGLPHSGHSWETMINDILINTLGFKNTTHERNLYRGTFEDQDVLICRMVDDYCIATADPAVASSLIAKLNEFVTTDSKGSGDLIKERGSHLIYNGVDLYQTRDYLKLSCETFIDRLLQTHGWQCSAADTSSKAPSSPITEDLVKKLKHLRGPAEGTAEHKALQDTMNFSYRQLLGELMYAYVVCRVDIAYAVCYLAKFSQHPHQEHYTALKNVARYLRQTKDWGIVYWRSVPASSLPAVPLTAPPLDESLPPFPEHDAFELAGWVDAAHGNDLETRKSVTGFVFTLAGGAVAYRSKLQSIIATSSSEAELYASVTAAKTAKYLRMVLLELGFPQNGPTFLYEDNQAVINVVNNERPTSNLRHVEIQCFAIQQWRANGDIELKYIPTTINSSDAQTKGLGWSLHSRHVRRSMGHHCPSYAVKIIN